MIEFVRYQVVIVGERSLSLRHSRVASLGVFAIAVVMGYWGDGALERRRIFPQLAHAKVRALGRRNVRLDEGG